VKGFGFNLGTKVGQIGRGKKQLQTISPTPRT